MKTLKEGSEKQARQEEFNKLYSEGNGINEEELLNKIRKHRFFQTGLSESEKWVHKSLREIPGKDRIPVMMMAAKLCEWSPEAFDVIHKIYLDASPKASNPSSFSPFVESIQNLYHKTKKLVDAGVDSKTAFYLIINDSEQVTKTVSGIKILKEAGGDINTYPADIEALKSSAEQTIAWQAKIPYLSQLYDELGLKPVSKIVKIVKNGEQLKTFKDTFDTFENDFENLKKNCFLNAGKWRYLVLYLEDPRQGYTVEPKMLKIGEYRKEPGINEGLLSLTMDIPQQDKDKLSRDIKLGTTHTEPGYPFITHVRIWQADGVFPIFIDMQSNFTSLFTKRFLEPFVDVSSPKEERLTAVRKIMEKFENRFREKEREVKVIVEYRKPEH